MADSSQKFIARNRSPRVQIEYDVELYGAEKKVQLPFVMGVLSDLSGKSHEKPPALEDRKFLEIDVDNFDSRMRAMAPRVEFSVPNTLTGEGSLPVDVTFESMDDFSPAAIARKVAPLRELLEARTQLANLMTYMDGKSGAEELIGKLMADPTTLRALVGVPGAGSGDQKAALDALRKLAPAQTQAPDDQADALASLARNAPADSPPEDTKQDVLDALAASAPARTAPDDTGEAALDALRDAAPADAPETDSVADALASIQAAPEETRNDQVDDALAALKGAAPEEVPEAETSDDILKTIGTSTALDSPDTDSVTDALASIQAVPEETRDDQVGGALAALKGAAPEEVPEAATSDDILKTINTAVQDTAPTDDGSGALEALRNAAPDEVAEDGSADAALEALRATPEKEAPAEDSSAAALDALRSQPQPEAAPGDDPMEALASLQVPEDAPEDTSATDALDALRDVNVPEAEDAPDPLAALDTLSDLSEAPVEDDSAATLEALKNTAPALDESDTTDDILSTLDTPADTAEPEADPLAALDTLSAPAEDAPADDGAATLDALRNAAVEEEVPEDPFAALDSLAVQDDADAAEDDPLAALDTLAAPVEDAPADDGTATLNALRDAAVEEETSDDPLAALDTLTDHTESSGTAEEDPLAALDTLSAPSEPETDETGAAALDALRDATVEEDAPDDPLAALDSISAAPAAEAEDPLAALDGLADTAPDQDMAADDLLAGLDDAPGGADTTEQSAEAFAADDPLTDLDDLLGDDEPEDSTESGDVLAGLDDLLGGDDGPPDEPPLAALHDDPLSGLDDLLGGDESETPDTATDDPAQVDDALAGLDDLLSDDDGAEPLAAADPAPEDDPLAGLGDLLNDDAAEEDDTEPDAAPDEGDDPLAGLDDLLADDTADADAEGDDPLAGLDDLLGDDAAEDPLAGLEDMAAEEQEAGDMPKNDAAPVQIPFGVMASDRPDANALPRDKFRIAILGDFSGRAAAGRLETGAGLAARRAIPFDVDDVEELIESFATTLTLPMGDGGTGISVPLKELDDLHPDELFDNVDIFAEIKGMRQRLAAGSMVDAALDTLRQWGAAHGTDELTIRQPSTATHVPADRKLSDFQALIGDTSGTLTTPAPGAEFIARIVGPHVVAAPDPNAEAMTAAVDEALSSAMRLILHAPAFQALESQWRSLDFMARRVETDETLELVLYDVSAEEIAADLAAQEDLGEAGLKKLLLDVPTDEDGPGAFSAVMGLYAFEETPPHAELLARIARVAAHIDAPFFTAISPEFMKTANADRHPLVAKAWDDLRAMPEAKYLGLATPRFLLRRPYGQKSDPVSAFKFEEFTPKSGLRGMLWANPVVAVTVLLAAHYKKNGKAMDLGEIMSLGDIPFHFMTDAHGDQVALPCTERNITTTKMEDIVTRGFMPVVSPRGRDEIRLASFQSVGGGEILGRWSGVERPAPSAPPETAAVMELEMDIPAGDADPDETDLDALLASLGGDDGDGDADDSDIDADLAALLEDL